MDFKNFLGSKEDKSRDLYWAIVLEAGWIQAGIWEIIEKKAEVVAVSPVTPWETDSEIIGASDAALSSAIQLLPEGFKEPSKTVFGIPPSWVDKGEIKGEYLSKIKNICTELSLEPSGFVVLSEAITHLIKAEEGSPVNAIIAGFGKDYLEISVFGLGNLIGTTQVARSVSYFEDITEGLSRFSLSENLPSRIIIYDGKEGELEDVKEALMASNWEDLEKIKFLHPPKIEIFAPDKKVTAVALAGAAEMAGVTEIGLKQEEPREDGVISESHQNVVTPEKSLSPQELGFVVGADIAAQKIPEKIDQQVNIAKQPAPIRKNYLDLLKSKLNRLLSNFPKRQSSINPTPTVNRRKRYLLPSLIFGTIVIAFILYWLFVPKTKIRIYVSPKRFEEKIEATVLKDSGSSDLANKILSGKIAIVEASGEKTKSTTGAKKIGDKAKGAVNIQNGTDAILKLSQGTIITAANDLKYSLANSASISAALSPSTPGTQVVEITAYDIGAEYNLAKNETFSVGSYPKSDVDAIATVDFTGGSSRDISAVSSDDTEKLLESLTSELTEKAKEDLLKLIPSDRLLIEDSFIATPSSKIFSNKVGDEASNIKLSLTLKSSAIHVSKKDLIDLSQGVLSKAIPSGFSIDENDIKFDFDSIKNLSSASTFNIKVQANFLPKEDFIVLSKEVAGKNKFQVEQKLSRIAGFVTAEISTKPKLPGIFGNVPLFTKHIFIEIVGER